MLKSITCGCGIMNKNLETLKNYESVREDMKYISNSISRLKIIKALYDMPSNTKILNKNTNVGYSAISTNVHMLELAGYICRENNIYYLSNVMNLYMSNIVELSKTLNFIDDFFYFLNNHHVQSIPSESLYDIGDLINANIIVSDGLNIYETQEFIENTIIDADYVDAVLPFYYAGFNSNLNELLVDGKAIKLAVPLNIKEEFDNSLIKSDNLDVNYFNKTDISFLLISTDKAMILGLFKMDGTYDQNRLLTANNSECLRWADSLFKNFKKRYK